jgi:IclR-like helix-turn-helix domain-containing protein
VQTCAGDGILGPMSAEAPGKTLKGWAMAGRPRLTRVSAGEEDFGRQQPGSVQALDRELALLEIIAQADGLSLTSIAQRAGIAPSTAHRILATLKASSSATRRAAAI